eukprot:1138365-Pelagomonas_calceolata.AAC.4
MEFQTTWALPALNICCNSYCPSTFHSGLATSVGHAQGVIYSHCIRFSSEVTASGFHLLSLRQVFVCGRPRCLWDDAKEFKQITVKLAKKGATNYFSIKMGQLVKSYLAEEWDALMVSCAEQAAPYNCFRPCSVHAQCKLAALEMWPSDDRGPVVCLALFQ